MKCVHFWMLKVMTDMPQDPKGRELLDRLVFKGLVPAEDHEWDEVRGLGIELLQDLNKHQ